MVASRGCAKSRLSRNTQSDPWPGQALPRCQWPVIPSMAADSTQAVDALAQEAVRVGHNGRDHLQQLRQPGHAPPKRIHQPSYQQPVFQVVLLLQQVRRLLTLTIAARRRYQTFHSSKESHRRLLEPVRLRTYSQTAATCDGPDDRRQSVARWVRPLAFAAQHSRLCGRTHGPACGQSARYHPFRCPGTRCESREAARSHGRVANRSIWCRSARNIPPARLTRSLGQEGAGENARKVQLAGRWRRDRFPDSGYTIEPAEL
jgi:hypothetical protein